MTIETKPNDFKMKKLCVSVGSVVCHIMLATSSWGQAACDVSPSTKQLVESLLCGQASQDRAYRQFGQGCFERSVTKRLEDTAIQVIVYEKCLDSEFSEEIMQANLKAISFMEDLSPCVSETVDLNQIMQERMEFAKSNAGSLNCTTSLRTKLEQRRPAFEAMIEQANEIDQTALLAELGVRIDDDGNVSDR